MGANLGALSFPEYIFLAKSGLKSLPVCVLFSPQSNASLLKLGAPTLQGCAVHFPQGEVPG